MLAPVPPKRKDGGSSFATLDRYIKEEVNLETGEVLSRGEVMTSDAILSPETAAAEMKAVATQNTRCKDPVMHVVLSWDKSDHPAPEQWKQSVNYVMKSLGMKDHQYTAVAHDDTENYHVHVMANKIHPETYRSHTPAWMHKTLDKALRELEHKHQWTPANGLYRCDEKLGKAVRQHEKNARRYSQQVKNWQPARPRRWKSIADSPALKPTASKNRQKHLMH